MYLCWLTNPKNKMKKYVLFPVIMFFLLTIIFFESCKKDSDPIDVDDPNVSGVMMTLSAISYVADSSTYIKPVKDSILHFLAVESLATGGAWQLAWGPGISTGNENLVFVAINTTGDNPEYAIAIRGTNVHSISNILHDLDVFVMVEFPYGMAGDSVARGPMHDFNSLLETKDSVSQTTLEQFLESISSSTKIPLYVTGHSLGGGLAPMMTYWLVTHDQFNEKFIYSTHAFAGPGWFNKSFRDNFLNNLPEDASFQMQVNSLDMIPYGYSNLAGILVRNVPVQVPIPYRFAITLADGLITAGGLVYYNIAIADSIGSIPITSTSPILDSLEWYNHWLMVEHNHNNYLRLLGVKPLD